MQFSFIAIFATVTAVAMAIPMPLHNIRSCDATKCAIALGPTGVGCLSAAAQAGADPIADAGCVAGVLNSAVNTPAACSGCATGVQGAISGAESAVSNAAGSAESAISNIF